MKVLLVHNYYQLRGGEDKVFESELKLLKESGIEVCVYTRKNNDITNLYSKIVVFFTCIFSVRSLIEIFFLLKKEKPDIVHVHNYFPLISPSVFLACKLGKVPVLHTLHNYRSVCPTATLLRDNKIFEQSVKGSSFWTVRHKTYKNSYLGTLSVYFMVTFHKLIRTWHWSVDCYIALTSFSKDKYSEAGWPSNKIVVKPNFLPTLDKRNNKIEKPFDRYCIYVGRLSIEKGIRFILESWEGIGYNLVIVGDGPESSLVRNYEKDNIHYVGLQSEANISNLLSNADFLIMASTWYEGLPTVLLEAMQVSTCALVPNLGGMSATIIDNYNGLTFKSGDKKDFTEKVERLLNDDALRTRLSVNANKDFCNKYTERNAVRSILEIYRGLM